MYKFNALITTFEMIISDCDVLSNIEWRCVAIDEAHRLKNRNCRLIEYLKKFDVVCTIFHFPCVYMRDKQLFLSRLHVILKSLHTSSLQMFQK